MLALHEAAAALYMRQVELPVTIHLPVYACLRLPVYIGLPFHVLYMVKLALLLRTVQLGLVPSGQGQ